MRRNKIFTGVQTHCNTTEVRLPVALRHTDNTEADLGNVDLGGWQPDFILVSCKRKRVAVVDLTR